MKWWQFSVRNDRFLSREREPAKPGSRLCGISRRLHQLMICPWALSTRWNLSVHCLCIHDPGGYPCWSCLKPANQMTVCACHRRNNIVIPSVPPSLSYNTAWRQKSPVLFAVKISVGDITNAARGCFEYPSNGLFSQLPQRKPRSFIVVPPFNQYPVFLIFCLASRQPQIRNPLEYLNDTGSDVERCDSTQTHIHTYVVVVSIIDPGA